MDIRRSFKLLLALLVTASLAVAPLVAPAATEHLLSAAGMQMTHMHMAGMADDADMAAVAADMPCCPDTQRSRNCADCPLVAICMMQVMQVPPSTGTIALALLLDEQLRPLDDIVADGLARPPPDHPPRILA